MLAVIQARMSSNRLPGKVLMPIFGEPMLQRVISRVALAKGVGRIIVATSSNQEDAAIYDYCVANGIECFRGPLENVADRFARIMLKTGDSAVIRICGDSPLIDPSLISQAISYFNRGDYDLVTNIFPRTFPKGQSVEIIKSNTFLKAINKNIFSNTDLEHVTTHFYLNQNKYNIHNFFNKIYDQDFSLIQQSVDTHDDFKEVERIISAFKGLTPDWLSIVKFSNSI